jgi:hypothetical protein
VASQARGGLPIVMEDGRGAGVARGRGLACYQAIHVCMISAIRGVVSAEESWDIYGRLLDAGLRPRNRERVGFDSSTRTNYFGIVEAALDRLGRGKAGR